MKTADLKQLLHKHEECLATLRLKLANCGTASNPLFVDYNWVRQQIRQEQSIILHLKQELERTRP